MGTGAQALSEGELDEMLADLPLNIEERPAYTVTDLDGNPAPHPAGETLADLRAARAARRAAFVHPIAANDDGDVIELDLPARLLKRRLAGNPKKRTVRPRTSYARDRRNLSRINGFEQDVRPAVPSPAPMPLVADPHPSQIPLSPISLAGARSQTKPSQTPSKSTLKRKKATENDTRAAPSWDRTTDIIRGHCYIRTVSSTGGGLAWTLNLGGKVLQAANDNPARFKPWMHDRLVKALKAVLGAGREFMFGIEGTSAGRWHLHGAIDATEVERPVIEEALRRAGGTWDAARHADKQAHARAVIWSPDGWARYIVKNMAATKRLLGLKSVLSVTRGCRQRAEALWNASRHRREEQSVMTDDAKVYKQSRLTNRAK